MNSSIGGIITTDILDKFIENAKQSLHERYYKNQDRERYSGEKASLLETLKRNTFTLICEIKHASLSGEYKYKKINVEKAAKEFRESGADAISVVVEPKIFRGEISNITLAKKAGLPVLFKDFVISEEQIIAARDSGADVILLVMKIVERLKLDLDGLIRFAHKNNLEILLESYDADELKEAMKTKADILGINNRDLRTLTVDIKRTENAIKEAGKIDRPLISESGIKTCADINFVKKAGASGALVGTAIWTAKNLREKIAELKGEYK